METKTILVLAANPSDTSRLRLDKEIREIQEGLKISNHLKKYKFEVVQAPRIKDIRRAMIEYRPFLVHFSGHGDEDFGLIVERENGARKYLDAEHLSTFFGHFKDSVECVFLNACYSEKQAKAIVNHIDHVIGMTETVEDELAISFAVAFYDAIFNERDYQFAYSLARNNARMENPKGTFHPVYLSNSSIKAIDELRWDQSYAFRLGYRIGTSEITRDASLQLGLETDKSEAASLLRRDIASIIELAQILSIQIEGENESNLDIEKTINLYIEQADLPVSAAYSVGKMLGVIYCKYFHGIAAGEVMPIFDYNDIFIKLDPILSDGKLGNHFLKPVKTLFFEITQLPIQHSRDAHRYGEKMDRLILSLSNTIRQLVDNK